MILDSLARHTRYTAWLPSLAEAFEFLLARANAELAPGRYEIAGERMFALVAQYETRDFASAEPEAHQKYLDVQYLIAGRETIYWTPREETGPVTQPYDAERDICFFARNERGRPFELAAGHFAIFLPEDAHEPNCHCGPPGRVHKAVVKVRV
ncbi:MAG: YhcH/YjgK/YiaL family protein [Planctomycetaceae bacterium]|nr:YhcH/YjgK/YiaL family protein [Planctomycetaceae bacterium]